jgi:capsular exopolysaccharide synthesis family protein
VIDGDMRRPTVHSSFGIENRGGLSNILSNDLSSVETLALVQKESVSGLYLLTSGPIPPNPAELVGSGQMRKLLTELQSTFDHIVIDTPPIASFTDGVLLAAIADGVILVVHANECSRKVIQRAQQSLQDVRARVLGVVLNRVHLRSTDYTDYYYHAYYKGPESEYTSGDGAPAS